MNDVLNRLSGKLFSPASFISVGAALTKPICRGHVYDARVFPCIFSLAHSYTIVSVRFMPGSIKEKQDEQKVTGPENVRVELCSSGSVYCNLDYCACDMGKDSAERKEIKDLHTFPISVILSP